MGAIHGDIETILRATHQALGEGRLHKDLFEDAVEGIFRARWRIVAEAVGDPFYQPANYVGVPVFT